MKEVSQHCHTVINVCYTSTDYEKVYILYLHKTQCDCKVISKL